MAIDESRSGTPPTPAPVAANATATRRLTQSAASATGIASQGRQGVRTGSFTERIIPPANRNPRRVSSAGPAHLGEPTEDPPRHQRLPTPSGRHQPLHGGAAASLPAGRG